MIKHKRSSHAEFFEKIFSRRENAISLIQNVLPESVQNHMQLDTLQVEPGSYVDEKLSRHFADLIFSIHLKSGTTSRVYCLLEHKSSPEYLVALQILRYMALEWHEMVKNKKITGNKLPPIIPIVVYQGHEDWDAGLNFQDVVDFPDEDFKAYAPDFEYLLWDLNHVDAHNLQGSLVFKYYAQICKSLTSEELPKDIYDLVKALYQTLGTKNAIEYIQIFFNYLVKSSEQVNKTNFKQALKQLPEGGDKVMATLAEQWMKEGEIRGREEGKVENSQEMLLTAIKNKFGVSGTSLSKKVKSIMSIETLKELFNQIFVVDDKQSFTEMIDKAAKKGK